MWLKIFRVYYCSVKCLVREIVGGRVWGVDVFYSRNRTKVTLRPDSCPTSVSVYRFKHDKHPEIIRKNKVHCGYLYSVEKVDRKLSCLYTRLQPSFLTGSSYISLNMIKSLNFLKDPVKNWCTPTVTTDSKLNCVWRRYDIMYFTTRTFVFHTISNSRL